MNTIDNGVGFIQPSRRDMEFMLNNITHMLNNMNMVLTGLHAEIQDLRAMIEELKKGDVNE